MHFRPFRYLSEVDKKAFLDQLHRERDHLFAEVAKLTVDVQSDVNVDLNIILKALEKSEE